MLESKVCVKEYSIIFKKVMNTSEESFNIWVAVRALNIDQNVSLVLLLMLVILKSHAISLNIFHSRTMSF
jgi:hypothetical protein